MTTHSFETNIPELIRRLGINLYNDALVAARELIQNANDACILAEGLLGNPKGRIDVTVDERRGVITVQDNGIGMTAEDLQTLLSTIASSKKAQLRRELERKDFEAAGGIAGQFGIGFLSTFIIADKVEVFTRHQSERGPGSHWSSGGDGNYDLVTSSANLPKGTRIVLAVKPEFRRQLTTQAISAALNQHAPFIRTNYHINGSGLPVNHDPAPWDDPENAGLAEAYVSHAFSRRPLIGFYLQHDGPPVTPNGQLLRLRLRGYVAIPDERIYGERVRVYTSGLLVGDLRDGLPDWATFVVGGIESPDIDLTLGRDHVMSNAAWSSAKELIAQKLTEAIVKDLKDARSRLRSRWDAVFRIHGQDIMEAALRDARHGDGEFYRAVKDLVPFRIGDDRLSVAAAIKNGKAIERNGQRLLFYHSQGSRRHESAGIQEALMFDEAALHFIDARNFYERDFLQQYDQDSADVKLVPVEEGIRLLVDWECSPSEANLIEETFRSMGIRAKLGKFRPIELSAVIIPSQDGSEYYESIDSATAEGRQRLFEVLIQGSTFSSKKPHQLCVNSNNLLVQELIHHAQAHGVDNQTKNAFSQIYFLALLVFGDTQKETIMQMVPGISSLMLAFTRRSTSQENELARVRNLLEDEREKSESLKGELAGHRKIETRPNSVFLAYGYDEETSRLVEPFKKMLKDRGLEPIDGKVSKAGSLSRQIVDRIRESAMFVGLLTPRDIVAGRSGATTSVWVIEEKGAATAFGLPVLLIVDRTVANEFYGNIEGDALRLEVEHSPAGWLSAFGESIDIILNTLGAGDRRASGAQS